MGQARKADRLLDQLAARVLDPHSAAPDDSVALAIAKLAIENSAKGNVGVKEGLVRRWNAPFILEVDRYLIPSSPTSKGGGCATALGRGASATTATTTTPDLAAAMLLC